MERWELRVNGKKSECIVASRKDNERDNHGVALTQTENFKYAMFDV